MQNSRYIKLLVWVCRVIILMSFAVSIYQNYFLPDSVIRIGQYSIHQFYKHAEIRLLPLIWASFFLIPGIKRVLNIKGDFYFSNLLINILLIVDAITHITGFYSYSVILPFYGRIWFDKIMHFAEGIVLIIAFYPIVRKVVVRSTSFKNVNAWTYWLILGFISIFFVVWEIVEVLIDKFQGTYLITGKFDTNEDLMFAYLGFGFGYCILRLYFLIKPFVLKNSE